MVMGWLWQKPFLVVSASGLFVILIVRWAWGHQSVLRVLPDRLISSVYLWNLTETALSDIETMEWLRGDFWSDPGTPHGIYISCAGRSKCVLPFVSKEQAKAATDAIFRKFPAYPINVPIPFTLPNPADLDPNKKA